MLIQIFDKFFLRRKCRCRIHNLRQHKKHKFVAIPIVGLIAIVITFNVVLSSIYDPENIVDKYVKGMKSSNWSAVYDTLDLDENDFINYDSFIKYAETWNNNLSEIKNYKIIDQDTRLSGLNSTYNSDNHSLIKTYTVNYVTQGTSESSSFTVKLIEQDKKAWLLYPSYKISTDGMISYGSISVLKGSSVAIDGIELTNSVASTNESLATYRTPYMFYGKHTVSVSHPQCESYEAEILIDDSYNDITIDSLEIKDDIIKKLSNETEDLFKSMCNAAIDGKKFDSLDFINISSDKTDIDSIKEKYSSLTKKVKNSDGSGLKSISFKEFEDESSQSMLNSDIEYSCRLDFDFDYIELYKDRYKNEISERKSSGSGYINVTYRLIDDEWVLYTINNFNLNY